MYLIGTQKWVTEVNPAYIRAANMTVFTMKAAAATVRALEKIIETHLRSYSARLPFSFFYHFRYQVM